MCSTLVWYGCCRLFSSNVIVTCLLTVNIQDVALFSKRCPCPCSDAVLRSVKKHWLGSFSIVLPPSALRGFVPVVRDRCQQGRARGGGRGPGTREHIYKLCCRRSVSVLVHAIRIQVCDYTQTPIQLPVDFALSIPSSISSTCFLTIIIITTTTTVPASAPRDLELNWSSLRIQYSLS